MINKTLEQPVWQLKLPNMKKIADLIEQLYSTAVAYVKTNVHLYRLKAVEKSADIASSLASSIVIAVVFLIFLTIISIGLAVWLGDVLGKMYYGFFIVGGFYGLLCILFIAFRGKLLKTPIANSIVHHVTK